MSDFESRVALTVNPQHVEAARAFSDRLAAEAAGVPVDILVQPDPPTKSAQIEHLTGLAERIDAGQLGALVLVNHGLRRPRPRNEGYPNLHLAEARLAVATGRLTFMTAGDRDHPPIWDELSRDGDVDLAQIAAERDLDRMARYEADIMDPLPAVRPAADNLAAIIEAARTGRPIGEMNGQQALFRTLERMDLT